MREQVERYQEQTEKTLTLEHIFTPASTWSWMRPRRGLPLVGTRYCSSVKASKFASALASSFCGRQNHNNKSLVSVRAHRRLNRSGIREKNK